MPLDAASLLVALRRLPEADLDSLIVALGARTHCGGAHAQRANGLVEWAQTSAGPGFNELVKKANELGLSLNLQSTPMVLRGRVGDARRGERDVDWLENVELRVVATDHSAITDGGGAFRLGLPADCQPGSQIWLSQNRTEYQFYQPFRGLITIPADSPVDVLLLPKGSPLFKAHDYLQNLVGKALSDTASATHEPSTAPEDSLDGSLRVVAAEYGLDAGDLAKSIAKWKEETDRESTDPYLLALAAIAGNEFRKAATLFSLSAADSDARACQSYEASGDALLNADDFRNSIASYENAIGRLANSGRGRKANELCVKLAIAKRELGVRVEGSEGERLLADAVAALQKALADCSRESHPSEWAMIQNNMGTTRAEQGVRAPSSVALDLLEEATLAFREVLKVHTREAFPHQWAMTQSNLGNVLAERGRRAEVDKGAQLLSESVTAYRAALEVRTPESSSFDWAMTQNNLGAALLELGSRQTGTEAPQLLSEAVSTHREVLKAIKIEEYPQLWASIQNNLATALKELSRRLGGRDGLELAAAAVAACRESLKVYTRDTIPQRWAAAQNTLGLALKEQGKRADGEEQKHLFEDSVAAFREALRVYTPETFPQQWAMTQNNLGNALWEYGTRTQPGGGLAELSEAAIAYREALRVYTRSDLPIMWARTQSNLGMALEELGARTGGSAGLDELYESRVAFEGALQALGDDDSMSYRQKALSHKQRVDSLIYELEGMLRASEKEKPAT